MTDCQSCMVWSKKHIPYWKVKAQLIVYFTVSKIFNMRKNITGKATSFSCTVRKCLLVMPSRTLSIIKACSHWLRQRQRKFKYFFPSRMGYVEPYESVHMETCNKGKGNPWGQIQTILSIAVAVVSVNEP